MATLNNGPIKEAKDVRFILYLSKREANGHIYDLFFLNNSEEIISNIEVARYHSMFSKFWEEDIEQLISKQNIENIKAQDRILVGEICEEEKDVNEFQFNFNITFNNENLSFSQSIKKESLLSLYFDPDDKSENIVVGTIAPKVKVNSSILSDSTLITEIIRIESKVNKS